MREVWRVEKLGFVSNVVTVNRLNTSEFLASVHTTLHALSPAVAVFDCDGTLWSGDAGSGFMNWTIETGLVSREATDWIDERYRGYLRGDVSEAAICGEMVQMYQLLREEEMRRAAEVFFKAQIERNIFPEMLALVEELRGKGVEIWAVSSTNNWVIEEGVRRFGIQADRVLAAQVEVKDGVVTDVLLDVPTDEGKVAALGRVGVTAPDAVFGNSVHDAAMLSIARRAFPVNPTPGLVEHSARAGWAVYYPGSVEPK
jgi:phosphoserine phosphatase